MLNKIYEKTKNYIINNRYFLLFLICFVIILNIKTPYIVTAPGGIIPLSDRITIDDKEINSNYYTTYVKVVEGKVAGVLASFIFPNWDLQKYEKYSGDVDLKYNDLNKIEKLLMDAGNNQAIITALNKANIKYEKVNNKLVVYYKHDGYINDLKIGDVINYCNDVKISNIDDLHKCIDKSSDSVKLNISRNGKSKNIKVNLYDTEDQKIIGISLINVFDIKSKYDIDIKSLKSESGSSGSFMTALTIYSELVDLKIPKGMKIAGTGTIEEDEKVGKIDGIKYKLLGSEKKKVDIFFVPSENYKEALKVKKKYHLKLKIVRVETIDDAINYLNKL